MVLQTWRSVSKRNLLNNNGWIPSFGALFHLNIPTGKSSFSSRVAEPIFKLLSEWELPADFSLGTNAGLDVPVRDAAGHKFARFLYAGTIGHPLSFLTEHLSLFVEAAGAVPLKANKPDEHTFDTGFVFKLTDRTPLDSFVQISLTETTTDLATGFGFSVKPKSPKK